MLSLPMLTTLITLLLSPPALALPSALHTRADEACAPTSYTISAYSLTTSPTSGQVSFTLQSSFSSSTDVIDSVQDGAQCLANGPVIPNSNECEVDGRRLLFDLRGPQDEAYYQITHTWTCEGYVGFSP
ncbi:hypothetical protein IAQ61_002149 [Plenodomus lingam]|uniref:uncharacterized protein n=1 Tax=Leptosphaeria maculans TaxID=5022 RepID=UPI0033298ED0|nr:hypothetical protein IAQ61_002149 [Plenodomus lingam]